MSPSINSKLRSLTLADQAMGLNMSPKVADMASLQHAVPTQSPIQRDVPKTLPKTLPKILPDTLPAVAPAQLPQHAAVQARQQSMEDPVVQDFKGIAFSATMLWGVAQVLPVSMQERRDALIEIQTRHNATCACCQKNTSNIVAGQGNPMAELFLIAEAPTENEELAGQPFAGKPGDKLNEMLNAMGLNRERIFMSHILKSRPPNDRPPTRSEVEQCGPYLLEEILVVRPKVIVSFGGPASKLILAVDEGITLLRGKWGEWAPPKIANVPPIWVMPTFHPAYLIRNYTQETRSQVWSDLQLAMSKLTPPNKM